MSDIIQLLPDAVANQIAAGEVIQRPASVIKELVENAVDAGSTAITVIIKDAGKTLIQIIDNGCGMSETDARLSFERHATSKIRSVHDIFSISTFGFRGEALASIASIAEVELKTRKENSELGTHIVMSGSEVLSQEPISSPVGSIFSIKNLFFNVPARRKFLKSNSVEIRHIINEFQRVCLCHPEIAFTLVNNGTEVYNLPSANLKQRIVGLMGKSIANNLIDINTETSIVKVTGFIGKPENAKKTSGEQFFFVNGRFFKSPYLQKAVVSAYHQLIQNDHYPSFFIYLDVDPAAIDINIHPTKTEIKFEDESAIWQIINASTREAIGKFSVAPSIDFNTFGDIEIPVFSKDAPVSMPVIDVNPNFNPFDEATSQNFSKSSFGSGFRKDPVPSGWQKLYQGFPSVENHPFEDERANTATFFDEQPEEEPQQTFEVRSQSEQLFFQLKARYILTPVKSGVMIIDQTKAHQRILYEYYLAIIEHHTGIAQQELFPQIVEFNPADYALLIGISEDLHSIGWDIRPFGGNSVAIYGSPASLSNQNFKEVLEGLLQDFKNNESDLQDSSKTKIARSMSIASAIKPGQTLSQTEMQDLFDKLFACESPNTSPGGKPTLFILGLDELEKRFK
ncbi:DNA mismatch repair endonuclease MutL [Alistipes sp. ZOR0009]|uniref:DNA mismatch repair endonuclease MutL n=1 Tax=Alistipes sp. ZOR0009 TaxID=1339253 RepID=UPI0006490094|nr:DNA mismatch repair endonuclease MutL [Alistipes sp. ZOR0009]